MDFDPQDQEIIRLLTRLKDADVAYPKDMLTAQRGKFLNQMAEVGLGSGADTGIKETIKDTPAPRLSPAASTLLEGALVIAIIAETGAMAYFYRDKLADFFLKVSTTSKVQEVSTQIAVPTVLEIEGVTPSPAMTSTLPSATLAASPTQTAIILTNTPLPLLLEGNSNSSSTAAANQTNSTPAPNVENGGGGGNGNNGNHYGQTPKPERTKENNGNGNSNNNSNNNNGNNSNNGNQNENNNRNPNRR